MRGNTSEVDDINRLLREHYGADADVRTNAMWRVVWAPDQIEERFSEWSEEGLHLGTPRRITAPKYQWIGDKWILERLVLVPEMNQEELLGLKKSYECIYIFETQQGEYLPAKFEAAKFVIDLVYAAQGKKSMRKYVDDAVNDPQRTKKIDKIVEELFGNETAVGDALAYKEGVSLSGPKLGDKTE